jgi:hypothetical protein
MNSHSEVYIWQYQQFSSCFSFPGYHQLLPESSSSAATTTSDVNMYLVDVLHHHITNNSNSGHCTNTTTMIYPIESYCQLAPW